MNFHITRHKIGDAATPNAKVSGSLTRATGGWLSGRERT